ncbi:hypothetical protein DSO57_1003991 [Entomophthora muscae]|uniref:Uncharacterized protein n=1 Tax=Entomophthora muscae TaxID=34485 RepID=A0ACC2SL67_9FUNG|nr:hypothetical protein DSO57_1003991 [Entomophthora muscae]
MSEKEYETRLPIEGEDGEQDQDDYEEFEDFEEPNVLRLIKWIPYMLKHLLWIVGCWIVVAIPIVILILAGNFEYSEIPKFNAEASGSPSLLAAMFLFWLGLMATLASIISFMCDIIPRVILKFTEMLFSGKTETVRHYIEFYTALIVMIKLVLTVVSIFFLFGVAFPASSSLGSASGIAWLNGIYKAIFCLLIFTLFISLEKLLLHLIAKRFHRTAYRQRLEESAYATQVLDSLNKARKEVKQPVEPPSPHFLSHRTFSEDSLNDRPIKKESGIYQNFNQAVFEGRYEDDVDLHSRTEARKLAHKIFRALQGRRRHLSLDDFHGIFPNSRGNT